MSRSYTRVLLPLVFHSLAVKRICPELFRIGPASQVLRFIYLFIYLKPPPKQTTRGGATEVVVLRTKESDQGVRSALRGRGRGGKRGTRESFGRLFEKAEGAFPGGAKGLKDRYCAAPAPARARYCCRSAYVPAYYRCLQYLDSLNHSEQSEQ